ncbi:unnamed protein product [Aureobasidium uvarum]|uniref:CBM-cenC domain-containing protein n=1 Tax=Aureobasidium uvarum TaxID=2773716 RepID=A0A9N8KVL6_9PEZI|nr:unnamed protein product [Aureobasidium uvarum]
MKTPLLTLTFGLIVAGSPLNNIHSDAPSIARRQDIGFQLVDDSPEPTIAPDNSTNYNQQAAISEVVASINDDPLPQDNSLSRRDMVVSTSSGYTDNLPLPGAAINAPLNCNGADTYMGAKLFTSGTFDTTLCATACSAQSAYNFAHPPSKGSPKTCQFYNTYVLYKDNVYQGQYCSMYTQAWDASYATNKGQWRDVSCPSDVPYLSANGADFCSSYINYQPPVSTSIIVSTPALSVVTSTSTSITTTVSYATEVQTSVASTTTLIIPPANKKRAMSTPVSISTWSPSRISKACSAVATGSTTTSTTATAATPYSTLVTIGVQTQTSTSSTTTTTVVVSTATVQPVNIVKRPGFEGGTGSESWQLLPNPGGWQIINDPSQAHSGNNYLVLSANSSLNQWADSVQTLHTVAGKYTLQFSYSYQFDSPGCYLLSSLVGAGIYQQKLVSSTNGWVTVTVTDIQAQTHNYGNLEIDVFCPTGYAYVHLDDIKFYAQ